MSKFHPDLTAAREAETTHEVNPFEPETRRWRFFNKLRESGQSLRAPLSNNRESFVNVLLRTYRAKVRP